MSFTPTLETTSILLAFGSNKAPPFISCLSGISFTFLKLVFANSRQPMEWRGWSHPERHGVENARRVIYIDAFLSTVLADPDASQTQYLQTRALRYAVFRKVKEAEGFFLPGVLKIELG